MNQQEIETLVNSAINQLIKEQPELLEYDVSERALTHHLANYIAQRFTNYHIDVEYNRLGKSASKYLDLPLQNIDGKPTRRRVFPDIVVHRRNSIDNLLVIEVKKYTSRLSALEHDKQKLKEFRKQLGYDYAMHVIFKGLEYKVEPINPSYP
jgi:hypothetical protein